MENNTSTQAPLLIDKNGTTIAFQKQGATPNWATLKNQIEEAIKVALGVEFYGKIFIKLAVPKVQENVSSLQVFPQGSGFQGDDVKVYLVAANNHK